MRKAHKSVHIYIDNSRDLLYLLHGTVKIPHLYIYIIWSGSESSVVGPFIISKATRFAIYIIAAHIAADKLVMKIAIIPGFAVIEYSSSNHNPSGEQVVRNFGFPNELWCLNDN